MDCHGSDFFVDTFRRDLWIGWSGIIASAFYGDGPRGGIDIEAVFFRLLITTLIGAVGGGLLARAVKGRYAGNKRRLDQFALIPAILAVVLLAYSIFKH